VSPAQIDANWYDYPQYFDLSFRDETALEVEFFCAAFEKYATIPVKRILEPGCGGGRLVLEMTRREFEMVAFDLSKKSVSYVNKRLRRAQASADVFVQDMTQFTLDSPIDAAFCTWNTFRHLLSESAAKQHLQSVAAAMRPGGIYILGLHLFPSDLTPEEEAEEIGSSERWTCTHAGTRVTATLRVLAMDRAKRIEQLRISLRVRNKSKDMRIRHEFPLRMYTAANLRRLLKSVPAWEVADVFDFWYDIEDPLKLNNEIQDTLLVLRRR
jgi:SAM-dependent methyltransferase